MPSQRSSWCSGCPNLPLTLNLTLIISLIEQEQLVQRLKGLIAEVEEKRQEVSARQPHGGVQLRGWWCRCWRTCRTARRTSQHTTTLQGAPHMGQ